MSVAWRPSLGNCHARGTFPGCGRTRHSEFIKQRVTFACGRGSTGRPTWRGLDLGAVTGVQCAEKPHMNSDLSPFSVYAGGLPALGDGASPRRDHQELWFSMARLPWASLVLVPADHGGSAAELATALAQVGTRLRDTPVTAVVANRTDFESARALAEFQPRLRDGNPWPTAIEVSSTPVAPAASQQPGPPVREAVPMPPLGRAIIAIQPVVDEPLGVAIAQAADAVVLCFERGKTGISSARRTIEIIGRERIIGAVWLK